MNTPRIVYPSNGGLMNKDFIYRTGADLRQDMARHRATTMSDKPLPVKHTSVLIVDQVLPVKRFGGV